MKVICMAKFAALLVLLSGGLAAQVQVDVHTEKASYFAGEPVKIILDMRNVGTSVVTYAECYGHVQFSVPNVAPSRESNIAGCYLAGRKLACIVDVPQQLKPTETRSFSYWLSDYRLLPGDYDLHVTGDAPVAGDVGGKELDATMRFAVVQPDQEALRLRFARYFAVVDSDNPAGRRARETIAEAAPPFLEKTLLAFLKHADSQEANMAAAALAQIDTASTRAAMRDLYRDSPGWVQSAILNALARTAAPDSLTFFIQQLPASPAVYATGVIGGDEAVYALKQAAGSAALDERSVILTALGNTKSSAAIPALLELSDNSDEVCRALATLTHRRWCSVSIEQRKASWKNWWNANAGNITIYGPDECSGPPEALPPIGL